MDSETARQIVMKLSGIIKHYSRMVCVKFGANLSKGLRPRGHTRVQCQVLEI